MARTFWCLSLSTALALAPGMLLAQAPSDPEVAKGIKLVDEGDYDGAILTLDNASRRLAADPSKTKDLSQAYLYLGIAYVGKGHEAAARAKFREALGQIKTLTLSPEKFPPKVIDVFEAARQEEAKSPTAKTSQKKGGGGKGILIGVGVAAAAGVGVAVAAGGKKDSGPTTPTDTRQVQTFTGSLCGYTYQQQNGGCDYSRSFDIVVSQPGTLEATVTWGNGSALFAMSLADQNYADVAQSNRTTNTSSQLTASVTPQTACPSCAYHLNVGRGDDEGPTDNFTLTVKHP